MSAPLGSEKGDLMNDPKAEAAYHGPIPRDILAALSSSEPVSAPGPVEGQQS